MPPTNSHQLEQLIIQPQGDTLTYLTGTVAPPVTPKALTITGRVDAPRLYLSKKLKQNGNNGYETPSNEMQLEKYQEPSFAETVIVINEDNNTITLRLDPNHIYGTIITGKLQLNPELVAFGIAVKAGPGYKKYNRESLYDLIRWNKRFFADPLKANELMAGLKKLDLKAVIESRTETDSRGNKDTAFKKEVTTSLPDAFMLNMPIYEGEATYDIPVEICIDTTEGHVQFWLESPRLGELIETTKTEIFDREIKDFVDDWAIVWE